ncbi:hypothetical protein AGDE_12974 [Angomonas deanei]|uniref:Uncharacterized conserved protein, putative n=1 Tax=Angomonas deanei TaxID=59799 RepID=A0A7G2CAT5_9TRYP|nr:hypothetical protein AGDE_12974 [Angomonas deanei]CAD2216565.1 Uncharacterised conserved protein, putative [Angomonas deanei]|eukprot:EPY23150.1 hypothetical protein AGDE_12974 [Angomonas deanei]
MNNIKEIIRSRTAKQKKFCTASAFYFAEQVHRMEVEDLFRTTKTNECLEIIRDLAEVLVWADKNEEDTFDQIVEGKIMETFERIVTNGLIPQEIKINVLSSITLILQNLSRVSSIYLLCSNNHINRMIAIEFDEQDDELLSRYISFLKSLSMRLNKDSVQLFFDREYDAFPLFSKTVKLLASDDALVRTAARQIVLNVAQIDDDAVKRYLDTTFMEICEIVLTSAVELITQLGATVPFLRQKRSGCGAGQQHRAYPSASGDQTRRRDGRPAVLERLVRYTTSRNRSEMC